jgi:hypothetical protein
MTRDYYQLPKSSGIMRFLWKCAGGDRYLLERATYSDQIKYMCLGGIVFATGAMAALAGGYAFFTIFSPRGSAIETENYFYVLKKIVNGKEILVDVTNWKLIITTILSIFFGVIWGLIIFNIDRFIVTSTGKGDGTEKITSDEIKSAIPRIIMGMIIAITISKPIEIRMFQSEINTALYQRQLKLQKEYEISTRKNFEDRLKDLGNENNEIQERVNDYIRKINIKDSLYNVETSSGQGGRIKGEGPVAKALKVERERLKSELTLFTNNNKEKINDIERRRKEINNDLTDALKQNKKVSSGLDGLVERIKLAHEVAGWTITIFIMLLFMAIELTPIFFKLMLTKSTYDYLAENRDELLKADYGIEVKYDYYKDKEGIERHLTINHDAERIIFEKRMVTNIQKELTKYAVTKYKEREKKKIDDNLDDYIKGIDG